MVFALPIPKVISIHAPRTGSDDFRRDLFGNQQISIHAPRTGSDGKRAGIHDGQRSFQSTLPARGATHCPAPYDHGAGISIHAPRTGSDYTAKTQLKGVDGISIHAPRTGSDRENSEAVQTGEISIHAPRTGSDVASLFL